MGTEQVVTVVGELLKQPVAILAMVVLVLVIGGLLCVLWVVIKYHSKISEQHAAAAQKFPEALVELRVVLGEVRNLMLYSSDVQRRLADEVAAMGQTMQRELVARTEAQQHMMKAIQQTAQAVSRSIEVQAKRQEQLLERLPERRQGAGQ